MTVSPKGSVGRQCASSLVVALATARIDESGLSGVQSRLLWCKRRMVRKVALWIVVTTLAATATFAQQFDVASVRPSRRSLLPPVPGAAVGIALRHPPGRFVAQNWSLRTLIAHAFALRQAGSGDVFQLRGGDEDVLGQAFDIEATWPRGVESVPITEERAMLRSLLADRFGLRIHRERQKSPVYALRRDGEALGPQLRPISVDCVSWRTQRLLPPTDADGNEVCRKLGGVAGGGVFDSPGAFGFALRDFGDMAYLVERVQAYVDRVVVDETGLAGQFAWELTFRPPVLGDGALKAPRAHPDLYRAIREQLGLTLVPSQAEVSMVVIDAVSMPTPN